MCIWDTFYFTHTYLIIGAFAVHSSWNPGNAWAGTAMYLALLGLSSNMLSEMMKLTKICTTDLGFNRTGCPYVAVKAIVLQGNKLLMYYGFQSSLGMFFMVAIEAWILVLRLSLQLLKLLHTWYGVLPTHGFLKSLWKIWYLWTLIWNLQHSACIHEETRWVGDAGIWDTNFCWKE